MAPDDLLARMATALQAVGASYMLTGSLASIYYGEPRMTVDIDLVVDLTPDQVDELAAWFDGEDWYFDVPMAKDALAAGTQFNVIHVPTGLKIDLVCRRHRPFSQTEFERRQSVTWRTGDQIDIARPEDLILAKLEFYREGRSQKHLRDIAGILRIAKPPVDRAYIAHWAAALDLTETWEALAADADADADG